MLAELSKFENLGTPGYFWELLPKLASAETSWTVRNINEHFSNRIIDGERVFDGCIPFAQKINVVTVEDGGFVRLSPDFSRYLASEGYMRGKLLERVMSVFKDDVDFVEIFSSKNMSYDVVYNLIQIEAAAFGFKYSNLRRLLLNFDFISIHPDSVRKYVVSRCYRRLFDLCILPETKRRKIGAEKLSESLEQRQIRGAEAEMFVLVYERNRLSGRPESSQPQRISEYDVGAGYDVISFNDTNSSEYDRFIEVKPCSVDRRFYWSRNEMTQARIKRDQYFLYLVDPEKLKKQGYEPIVIQNPFDNVFMSPDWEKDAQSWLIQPRSAV